MSECKYKDNSGCMAWVMAIMICVHFAGTAQLFKKQAAKLDAISAKLGIEPKPADKAEKEPGQ